jgi:hypothetical protein
MLHFTCPYQSITYTHRIATIHWDGNFRALILSLDYFLYKYSGIWRNFGLFDCLGLCTVLLYSTGKFAFFIVWFLQQSAFSCSPNVGLSLLQPATAELGIKDLLEMKLKSGANVFVCAGRKPTYYCGCISLSEGAGWWDSFAVRLVAAMSYGSLRWILLCTPQLQAGTHSSGAAPSPRQRREEPEYEYLTRASEISGLHNGDCGGLAPVTCDTVQFRVGFYIGCPRQT